MCKTEDLSPQELASCGSSSVNRYVIMIVHLVPRDYVEQKKPTYVVCSYVLKGKLGMRKELRREAVTGHL